MSAARFVSLLLSALCLSACAAGPSGEAVGRYPAPGSGVQAEPPLATLPAVAGRIVAVRRVPYANGFGQEIVLDGPRAMSGENRITVETLTTAQTGVRGMGIEELRLVPPTDTDIAAEMDRLMPGVTMHLAALPVRGTEGSIGYAFGTAGHLSCVYAWQYLAPARPLSLFEGGAGTGVLPMSVRVRLCREQPLAALVETMRGLRVLRPEDSSLLVAVQPQPGGDALDAAMGALPTTSSHSIEAPQVLSPITAEDSARLTRRSRHRLAASRKFRHRVTAQAAVLRRRVTSRVPREHAVDLARLPAVPMPGDIAATASKQLRVEASPPPRSASLDSDAMPMPR